MCECKYFMIFCKIIFSIYIKLSFTCKKNTKNFVSDSIDVKIKIIVRQKRINQ